MTQHPRSGNPESHSSGSLRGKLFQSDFSHNQALKHTKRITRTTRTLSLSRLHVSPPTDLGDRKLLKPYVACPESAQGFLPDSRHQRIPTRPSKSFSAPRLLPFFVSSKSSNPGPLSLPFVTSVFSPSEESLPVQTLQRSAPSYVFRSPADAGSGHVAKRSELHFLFREKPSTVYSPQSTDDVPPIRPRTSENEPTSQPSRPG